MDNKLSNNQISQLVTFLIEDHGLELNHDRFTEEFLLFCEDVAGWNLYKPQKKILILDTAFTIYQETQEENQQ